MLRSQVTDRADVRRVADRGLGLVAERRTRHNQNAHARRPDRPRDRAHATCYRRIRALTIFRESP